MTDKTEEPAESVVKEKTEEEILSEKEKYFESLKNWLHQGQAAQANAYFPYYFVACQMLHSFQATASTPFLNNNYQQQAPYYQLFQNYQDARQQNNSRNNRPNQGTEQANRAQGVEFVIPPIWKRFIAEILDFFILFVSKVLFYYITDDYLGILDFNKYSIFRTMNLLRQASEDYEFALEVTSEIFMLELINRLGAVFFEAMFLSDSLGGAPWGATPGKLIMGLRVVSATNIVPVENRRRDTVLVHPGVNISFKVAVLRSAIKNALFTLVFPVCIFTLFFQHNRTTYDVLSNVIVVEHRFTNQRRQ